MVELFFHCFPFPLTKIMAKLYLFFQQPRGTQATENFKKEEKEEAAPKEKETISPQGLY